MENSDDASTDIEELENSLTEELEPLHVSSIPAERCIFRVPKRLRLVNQEAYTPQVVSFGLLHHGATELKAAEEHKKKRLKAFLLRTKVRMKDLIEFVKDREAKLRKFYAEDIKFGSRDFVKMILMDATFLIEIFFGIYGLPCRGVHDHGIYWMIYDGLLLENQLPLFILKELLEFAKNSMSSDDYELPSIEEMTSKFLEAVGRELLIDKNSFETLFSQAKHFLDLIILCLEPSNSSCPQHEIKPLYTPSVTELHQAGVKFRLASGRKLLDITFKDGILDFPVLTIAGNSESLFRNLLAYEQLGRQTHYLTHYLVFINYLVNSSKDVELLSKFGVIYNCGWFNEELTTIIHSVVKHSMVSPSQFYYFGLVQDLKAYCKKPWNRWKAILRQNYFNTPWASVSVIAAVVLLTLTLAQTVFSIIKK